MSYLNNKLILDKYPNPITVECTAKILEQMKNSICKINNENGRATGFFCYVDKNKKLPVMITNNHIINEKIINATNNIIVTLNDDREKITININDDRKIYTSQKYDITIIEIKEEKIKEYIELDINNILEDNFNIINDNNENIYILHYPEYDNGQKASVSYGILKEINNDYDIKYICNSNLGSCGAPILNISNNKVIGIHKESSINSHSNMGVYLKYPIKEYINNINLIKKPKELKLEIDNNQINEEIKSEIINNKINEINNDEITEEKNEIIIKVKVDKNDIDKDIFFLDNSCESYLIGNNWMSDYGLYLKELNESNVEVYINDLKYKFKKYFQPKKEGIYNIKLKFKIKMKSCFSMFYRCKNIISIDLSSFYSKDVMNMGSMFYYCTNLTSVDLSNFETKNAYSMDGMFGFCSKLTNLDLTSFDTTYINSLTEMFKRCNGLETIKIKKESYSKILKQLLLLKKRLYIITI